jgi:uncharacterized protein DUF4112
MNRPDPPPAGAPPGSGDPAHHARLRKARAEMQTIAWLLDGMFRVPGTRFRFGFDPIIGLIPAAGDLVSGAVGLYLITRAVQFRLPMIVVARMVLNSLLDFVVGAVPILGDLFDFAFRSNARNMQLFEEYVSDPERGTGDQWLFFVALLAILIGVVWLLALVLGPLLGEIDRLLRGLAGQL